MPCRQPAALKAAVRQGADAVYVGFRDDANARHFSGLNFNDKQLESGISFAQQHNKHVYIAVNTHAQPEGWNRWQRAVDQAADLGVNALIAADPAVLAYPTKQHPELNVHLSVQGSATNAAALSFYQDPYNIKRAVLPRVLSLAQVKHVARQTTVPIEVFAFGSLCIVAEGRYHLFSYLTNESSNLCGVCSRAKDVRWSNEGGELTSRLNDVLIDRYSEGESAGYPTLCKGRFMVNRQRFHALEEPTSLDIMDLIPELAKIGVSAVKIEGRQRSPAYVESVTRVWRAALDSHQQAPERYQVDPVWRQTLAGLSEGSQTTPGAYHRSWQ